MKKPFLLSFGIILIISFLIFHTWISFDIFSTGDWGYRFSESSFEMRVVSFWESGSSFGNINISTWRWSFHFIESLFGNFGFGWNISEKFLIMFPVIVFFPYISYLFLRRLKFPFLASITGSFVFCYNSYFLSIYTHGHIPLAIAGAWGVLALYFCMHLVEKKRMEWAFLAGIMLSLAGYYDFRFAYIFFFVCSAFLAMEWVREVWDRKYRRGNSGLLRKSLAKTGGEEKRKKLWIATLGDSLAKTGIRKDLLAKTEGEERRKRSWIATSSGAPPRKDGEGWKLFWFSGVFVAVFVGLNVFWVLPFMNAGSMGDNAGVGRDLFGNDYFELDDAMYLSHPFWTGYGVRWMSDQPTPWWLSILGVLAWVGFWVGVRKNAKCKMQNEKWGVDETQLRIQNAKEAEEGKLEMRNNQLSLRPTGTFSSPSPLSGVPDISPQAGAKESGEWDSDWEENRRRRYILFFAVLSVIGILLSKQVSDPFGNLYYWLYDNFPGFNAFREASKFYILIALGYAVGMASLVEWLLPPSRHGKKE